MYPEWGTVSIMLNPARKLSWGQFQAADISSGRRLMIKELDGNFLTRFLFLLFSFSTLTKRNQGKKRKMELFVGSIIHQWCGLTANYAEIWDDTTHFHFFCWCDIWRNKLFLSCLTVFAKLLGSSNKHDSMMRQFHVTIFPDSSRQLVWVWSFFCYSDSFKIV